MFGIWWLTSTKRKKYVIKDYNGTTEKIRHFTTSRQKSPSNVIRSSRLSSNSLSLRVALSRDFHLLRMCINFASFFCVSHSQRLALIHVQQIIKTGIYYIKQTLTSRHKWSGENSLIKWVEGGPHESVAKRHLSTFVLLLLFLLCSLERTFFFNKYFILLLWSLEGGFMSVYGYFYDNLFTVSN